MSVIVAPWLPPRNERKPRSVLVIAPRSIIDDELRMMRLEEYLQAEFPNLSFVMAPENNIPGNQSAVGVMSEKDGTTLYTPEEVERITDEVSSAMHAFVNYQKRAH